MTVSARSEANPLDPPRRSGTGPVLLLAVSAVVAVDLGATVLAGRLERGPVVVITFFAALAALIAAGAIILRMPGQRSNGRLMLAMAGAASAVDLLGVRPEVGPAAFLVGIATWYSTGLFGQLLLRWPGERIGTRVGRTILAVAYVALPAMTLAWQLRWDRRWFGPTAAGWWWPAFSPDRDLAYQLFLASQLAFVALIVAFVGLVVVRIVRASSRTALLPVGIAGVLLASSTVAGVLGSVGIPVPVDPDILQNLAILSLPVAALIGVAVLRSRAADGGTPLVEVAPPSDRPARSRTVRLALRSARGAFVAALLLMAVVFGARSASAAWEGSPVPTPQPLPAPVAPSS